MARLNPDRTKLAAKFLKEDRPWRGPRSFRNLQGAVNSLHSWMERNNLGYEQLTANNLDEFLKRPVKKELEFSTSKTLKVRTKAYLRFLHREGYLTTPPNELLPFFRKSVSPEARYFLVKKYPTWKYITLRHYRHALYCFESWLAEKDHTLQTLETGHLAKFFLELADEGLSLVSIRSLEMKVKTYLKWQYESGNLKRFPKTFFEDHRPASKFGSLGLPPHTDAFFSMLKATLRKSSVQHYVTALRHLYSFMDEKRIDLSRLRRIHLEEWMTRLKAKNLAASTRQQIIVSARGYFHWLYEHEYIGSDPDAFIRLSDIPKRPKYLPRPLPSVIDRELIARLSVSDDICHQGLLLMRFTGIRIGELCALPFNCTWEDTRGNSFLKVPLGKLDNERMIPLDRRTLEVLKKVRARGQDFHLKNKREGSPEWLLCNKYGQRFNPTTVGAVLKLFCTDIKTDKPITSHRLRHTYATSLLSGGMSLVGIMHLLGHHSLKMTLCYAAVTQETIRDEYFAAIDKLEGKYDLEKKKPATSTNLPARESLSAAILWLKQANGNLPSRKISLLVKRLHRLNAELASVEEDL